MTIATEAWFRGHWQMVRIIENVPEGVIGEFWGECSFTPDGHGLTCDESGVLRFRGADYHSGRVSLWRFPRPGHIEVRSTTLTSRNRKRAIHAAKISTASAMISAMTPGSAGGKWRVRKRTTS
jgi:hypothetical protein